MASHDVAEFAADPDVMVTRRTARRAAAGCGVVLAAGCYAVAQPPGDWWLAAWVAPGLLLASTAHLGARDRALAGAAFGALMGWGVAGWAIDAALVYFDASRLSATLFLATVWVLCLSPAYAALAVVVPPLAARVPPSARPLVAGVVWASAEWARAQVLPWGLLAHSQTAALPILQIADLGGAAAVAVVVVAASVGLGELLLERLAPAGWSGDSRDRLPGACAAIVLVAATLAYGRWRLATLVDGLERPSRLVMVVQDEVGNDFRWRRGGAIEALTSYAGRTAAGVGRGTPDLIVWPENAVDLYLDREGLLRAQLGGIAALAHDGLLLGAPRLDADGTARNAAYLLDARGGVAAQYDKRHLLPFGEYRPWPFDRAPGALRYAAGTAPGLVPVGATALGVTICWDATFARDTRAMVAAGAEALVQLSNDAWLDHRGHAGPSQHFATVVLRAIETRRWLVRAATGGPSGFVTPTGQVASSVPAGGAGARTQRIVLRDDVTPYVRTGDAWLLAAATGLAALARRRRPEGGDA